MKKTCSKCRKEKPISNFNRAKVNKDGYCGKCKECVSEYMSKYQLVNRKELSLYAKIYNQSESQKQRRRNYYIINKETISDKNKIYYIDNKETIKKRTCKYREDHQNQYRLYNRKFYDLNKNIEEFKIKRNSKAHGRRLLEKNAGNFTPQEWKEVLVKYGEFCLHCGSTEHITIDHVIALSQGGSNTKNNLQPLCKTCNCSKGIKAIDYRI